MARQFALTSLKQISEINLTPLMDLTFILLITFIITFPLIEQGVPIQLPKGKANELDNAKAQTVTLDREGAIFLGEAPVTLDALNAQMRQLASSSDDLTVMVRADERIAYGKVVQVLKVLNDAQITRMALVTQSE